MLLGQRGGLSNLQRTTTLLALGLLLFSPCSLAQTTPTESQALQALLAEVHQLRQDLQTAATAARRAQILIYRLYAQEAAVARASQRFDEAKSALDQFQAQQVDPLVSRHYE